MRTLHRSVTGLIASLLVMGGCGLQAPELDEDDFEQMYMVALDGNAVKSRGFRLRLRFASGAWRVSRIEEVPAQDVVGTEA